MAVGRRAQSEAGAEGRIVGVDAEFSKLVDQAAAIATSGRWDAVNSKLEGLAASPGEGNAWWVELIMSLCSQNFIEYLLLKRSYVDSRPDSALLAWRARNLLELSVWSIYCAQSRDNARRFYEDAGRDARGVYDAFIKWGSATGKTAEWLDPLAASKRELSRRALRRDGIQSLEGPYKKVSEAAFECDIGEHFTASYKLLSKTAHPTAMRILFGRNEEREGGQRDLFFSHGCLYFTGAFGALENATLNAS